MESQRFSQQLTFLTQVDKMKNILRQTLLADGSRRETDAEHSWHFALMAMVLYEYCALPHVDLNRVLKMALVHDLVEIYAGDTFCYDQAANEDKALREKQSADRLFALLPEDQGEDGGADLPPHHHPGGAGKPDGPLHTEAPDGAGGDPLGNHRGEDSWGLWYGAEQIRI